jgi:hypothetical protein
VFTVVDFEDVWLSSGMLFLVAFQKLADVSEVLRASSIRIINVKRHSIYTRLHGGTF